MITEQHVERFSEIYAEAVLTFLDSGDAQWLTWDGLSLDFDFQSVELDPPTNPVMLFVDASWTQVIGDVDAVTDPEADEFEPFALRDAIVAQISGEGYAERLLIGFQERLAKLEEDGELDEPPMPGDED